MPYNKDTTYCKRSKWRNYLFSPFTNEHSIGNAVSGNIKVCADSGYQGILKHRKNSETPKKKPRGRNLSNEEKVENRRISVYLLRNQLLFS